MANDEQGKSNSALDAGSLGNQVFQKSRSKRGMAKLQKVLTRENSVPPRNSDRYVFTVGAALGVYVMWAFQGGFVQPTYDAPPPPAPQVVSLCERMNPRAITGLVGDDWDKLGSTYVPDGLHHVSELHCDIHSLWDIHADVSIEVSAGERQIGEAIEAAKHACVEPIELEIHNSDGLICRLSGENNNEDLIQLRMSWAGGKYSSSISMTVRSVDYGSDYESLRVLARDIQLNIDLEAFIAQ